VLGSNINGALALGEYTASSEDFIEVTFLKHSGVIYATAFQNTCFAIGQEGEMYY